MKDKIKSTEINVNKENIIPIADVKQESQCVLTLELYKDNVAFDITGQTVKLGAKTADGNVQLQESGFTINKNILTVDLKSSINSVVGLLEIDLTFTDSTGIMTTSSFYLNVIKKTLGKDNIIASNQLEAVKVLIEDLKTKGNNTIADIKKDYDSLKKVIIDNNAAANLQVQINENKQQSVENTNRIEQLEDLTPVWQEHEGAGSITVNDSFDGVTKDLVVRGRTLFNIYNPKKCDGGTLDGESFRTFTLTSNPGWYAVGLQTMNSEFLSLYKTNTMYTIITEVAVNTLTGDGELFRINENAPTRILNNTIKLPNNFTGILISKVRTKTDFSGITHGIYPCLTSSCTGGTIKIRFMIIEGDLSENEIPSTYFDSITSAGELEGNKIKIKSVGKNLFEPNYFNENSEAGNITRKLKYKLKPNTQYTCSSNIPKADGKPATVYFNGGSSDTNGVFLNTPKTFTSNSLGEIDLFIRANDESGFTIQDFINGDMWIQLEENSIATNYEQYREKLIEIPLPFAKGLKSTLDGTIYDEINGNTGEIIQRVSEEYTELPKENIYKIPKDYLRFFNGTTNILQENNITSILKFEYPLNKDASIVSGLLINDILESEIKNNNNNISELNTKLTENKNDIDYLDSKITTSTNNITTLNSEVTTNTNNITTLNSKVTTNTNNITTLNSKVTTNTNSINNLKTELAKHNIQTNPLWEGASFLADGQELTLNKSLNNCRNGVVLVWSQYNTSTDATINERFAFVFIRKNTIVQNLNRSFGCLIANTSDRVSSYDHIITKYVNVSGTRVVGWRGNNQYQNAQSVLRAVYEW